MTKVTKLPKNSNTSTRTSALGRKKGAAHTVNLGKASTTAMRLAQHINKALPDWARNR